MGPKYLQQLLYPKDRRMAMAGGGAGNFYPARTDFRNDRGRRWLALSSRLFLGAGSGEDSLQSGIALVACVFK
jgi:hypothetical protein